MNDWYLDLMAHEPTAENPHGREALHLAGNPGAMNEYLRRGGTMTGWLAAGLCHGGFRLSDRVARI